VAQASTSRIGSLASARTSLNQQPRVPVDRATHRRLVDAFRAAAGGGDLDGLLGVLDSGWC
jgi:hypothetical protein